MDGWTGGVCVGGQTGRVCRWVGGVDGWMDGWTGGVCVGGQTGRVCRWVAGWLAGQVEFA